MYIYIKFGFVNFSHENKQVGQVNLELKQWWGWGLSYCNYEEKRVVGQNQMKRQQVSRGFWKSSPQGLGKPPCTQILQKITNTFKQLTDIAP